MVTVWTPQAITELKKAYKYISQDSPQNAKMVIDEIILLADKLPDQQEIFPPPINLRRIMTAVGELLKSFGTEFHTA